ncbi:hypothetical protein KO500_01380 [Cellulophaga baltica]|uniref:hypothetical protein n=1 Tax=Cellulophaga TaxID=104264 RepID=UPI001C068BAE|nr:MULTISPECIES: hypothetical protein [Cellulophaga]MBU2995061.1 hypothetical protein [Cellulophaga baltica]MDO6766456.1 hypothetical protein [Cellulophaga sp. 1_MG-2023]
MIIFGSRSVHINTEQLKNTNCPNCDTKESMLASVYRRHAHVFWIPVFPLSKFGATTCNHCKQTLRTNEMPSYIKTEFKRVKKNSKGPAWQFSGLILFALLIVFAGFASKSDRASEKMYLETPLVGDVYEYKLAYSQYSTMKIMQVTTDSIFVSLNDYEINKASRIYRIDKSENYSNKLYVYSKKEITDMYNSKIIFDINRE